MSNVYVMHRNFITSDLLTSQTKSSELAAAPVTNLYDRVRRTKTYRTAGYWEITSANKTIIFRESVGVDLTATIAEDNYTTDASFLTAIKTALDAAGASTYTVTRNTTTLKIVITSNGSGGDGIFQLMWTDVLSTAYDVLGYSNAADDTGALTYTADSLRIHTSEWVRWDLGTATNIQAFAIIGTRLAGLNISPTATVKLQGNTTDVWTAPQYESTLEYNEFSMGVLNSSGLYTGGLRYWRLHIVDRDNPAGYVEIASAYLGELINPTTGCPQFPIDIDGVDFSQVTDSEWGTKFATARQMTEEWTLRWEFLSVAEKEQLKEVVELYKTAYPFWVALDPNEVFTSAFQMSIMQVQFEDLPKFQLTRPGQYQSDWRFRECV